MFLVHARGLKKDGTHPVFLYGYGGFEASIQPFYKSVLNLLLSSLFPVYFKMLPTVNKDFNCLFKTKNVNIFGE